MAGRHSTRPSSSFPRRQESTGWVKTMQMHRHVIPDLIRNPEGWGTHMDVYGYAWMGWDAPRPARVRRHTGFKAVSTGRGKQDNTTIYRHSRVGGNPQGGRVTGKPTQPNPLSLDGRGIKEPVPVLDTGSEGDSKTVPSLRPSGLRIKSAMTCPVCTHRACPHPVHTVINQCRCGASAWARRMSHHSPQLASYG